MGHFIVRGLFTRVKSPTNFKKTLAFLAHLVPWFWIGWWLWRAGCISQDTYILYNINVNCVNLKVFSEYFLINWIYLAIFNVLGRTSHFSLLMILGLKFCRQAHRYQGCRLLRIIYRTITSSWRPPPSNWNAPHVSWPWGVWKRLWTGYHPLPRDG